MQVITADEDANAMELWDVNCLLGRWPSAALLFHDVAGLLARMDQLGIARAAVSHTDCLHYDPVVGNANLMQLLAQAQPDARARLWPVWVLVPPVTGEQGTLAELAVAMDRAAIRLARLYPRDHNYSLSSPDAAELLALLAARRTLTLLDLEQSSWEELDRIAAAYPALPLIVCNVGYRGLRRFAGVLARRPNVHVDLSFLASHQGLEWLVGRAGAGQFLFGTGAPLMDGAGGATPAVAVRPARGGSGRHRAWQPGASARGGCARAGRCWRAPRPAAGAMEQPAEQVLRGEPVHGAWDVIDAHAHVGPWFNFFTPEPTPDSMLRVMDRCGVRMAVVSATRAISTEVLAGNAEVVQMVRRHPRRFAGYAVFNPHEAESLADVERALDEPGIMGIKVHPDVQAYAVNGPLYAPIWELAARRDVPILTHTFADFGLFGPAHVRRNCLRVAAGGDLARPLGRHWRGPSPRDEGSGRAPKPISGAVRVADHRPLDPAHGGQPGARARAVRL